MLETYLSVINVQLPKMNLSNSLLVVEDQSQTLAGMQAFLWGSQKEKRKMVLIVSQRSGYWILSNFIWSCPFQIIFLQNQLAVEGKHANLNEFGFEDAIESLISSLFCMMYKYKRGRIPKRL